jgi:hypothetical protein
MNRSYGPKSSRDLVYAALVDQGFRPTRNSDDFMSLCPVHEDREPSLHVTWHRRPEGGGAVVVKCFGCDATAEDIMASLSLDMDKLFDDPLPPPSPSWTGRTPRQRSQGKARPKAGRMPARIAGRAKTEATEPVCRHRFATTATYMYVDRDGAVRQESHRRACSSCGAKTFIQRYVGADGELVTQKPEGWQPVLFRLPELLEGLARDEVIWLVEGEKDAEAGAGALRMVTTTNANGGGGFPPELAGEFSGARVHVVLDRDAAGWARGVTIHELLGPVAAELRFFLPATTAAKSDLADHVEAGFGVDDLVEVTVEELRVWRDLATLQKTVRLGLETCDAEARARMTLCRAALEEVGAEPDEEAHGAAQLEAGKQHSFAQRWGSAAVLRWEGLRDDVGRLRHAATGAGTSWAAEASALAGSLLLTSTELVRALYEEVEMDLPAELLSESEPSWRGADLGGTSHLPGRTTSDTGTDSAARAADSSRGSGRLPLPPGAPRYELLDGCIVQIKLECKRVKDAKGKWIEEWVEKHPPVLNLDVRIAAFEFPDVVDVTHAEEQLRLIGRDSRKDVRVAQEERKPARVVFTYTNPATGQEEIRRVEHDRAVDSSWLAALDIPGLAYDSRPAGRAKVWDAIRQTSLDLESRTLYLGTGWRQLPEHGWAYIHAGGAITAKGNQVVPVSLTGALRRFDLPDPVADGQVLRRAWMEHAAPLLDALPARIGAPLIGHAFRAVLGTNPWLGLLVGSPGSRKTGLGAILMHFFGEAWDRRRPAVSMSGSGSTDNAIRHMAHWAKDALLFLDDVAPGKDLLEGQIRMGRIARMLTNGEERARLDRTMELRDGTAPTTTGLMTSELMPRPGSEAERMFPIPLKATDIPLETLVQLDQMESRYARALLGSSFRMWLADDLLRQQDRANIAWASYSAKLREAGRAEREADAYGQLWAGWKVLTDFLVGSEALSREERDELLQRVDAALWAAMWAAENPDVPLRRGDRVREVIAHALGEGLFHLSDIETGDCPQWPIAARLGWRRIALPGGDPLNAWRHDPKGSPAGWVNLQPRRGDLGGPQVLMTRLQLDQVITTAARTLSEAPLLDSRTAMQDLADVGVLVSHRNGDGRGWTQKRTIYATGAHQRMVVLDLHRLLGDEPDEAEDDADPSSPPGTRPPARHDDEQDGVPGPDDVPAGPDTGSGEGTPDADGNAGQEQLPLDDAGPAGGQDEADLERPPHSHDSVATTHEGEGAVIAQDLDGTRLDLVEDPRTVPCVWCGYPCASRLADGGAPIHRACVEETSVVDRQVAIEARRAAVAAARAETCGPAKTTDRGAETEDAGAGERSGPQLVERPGNDSRSAQTVATPIKRSPVTRAADRASARRRSNAPAGQEHAGRVTWDGVAELSRPAAVVLDVGRVVLGDGTSQPMSEAPRHIGEAAMVGARLGLRAVGTKSHDEPGTVVISTALAEHLGLPVADLPTSDTTARAEAFERAAGEHPWLTGALAVGWSIGDRAGLRGWNRLRHPQHGTVLVAIQPVMSGPVVADDPDAVALARRLQLYADHVGYGWHIDGLASGTDLMIGLQWQNRGRLFVRHDPIEPVRRFHIEPDLNWCRPLGQEEAERLYVHVYDRGGSYAAGIAGLSLPIGDAVHHRDGIPWEAFDPALPGFYRIRVPEAADWRLPHPIYLGVDRDTAWVASTSLGLAAEWEYVVEILESYVWLEHGRFLDGYYARMRDARAALDTEDLDDRVAREMVKDSYTRPIGDMRSARWQTPELKNRTWGSSIYFPERGLLISSKARCNLLRRAHSIGEKAKVWPVAMLKDSIAYVSDEPDPVKAWPGDAKNYGRGFGQLRAERSGWVADQAQFLTGGPWRGKLELMPAAEWQAALQAGGPPPAGQPKPKQRKGTK